MDFIKLNDWFFYDKSKLTLFYSKNRTFKLIIENINGYTENYHY